MNAHELVVKGLKKIIASDKTTDEFRKTCQELLALLQGEDSAPTPVPEPTPDPDPAQYALGVKLIGWAAPWKICSITVLDDGTVIIGICNNESRTDSKLIRLTDGKELYSGNDETIGEGVPSADGSKVYFAGECGNLLALDRATDAVAVGPALKYSSCVALVRGAAYAFNNPRNAGIEMVNCATGNVDRIIPAGEGIPVQVVDGITFWIALAGVGLLCSDGSQIALPNCQGVVNFGGEIISSSGNKLVRIRNGAAVGIASLPCEKIMRLCVWDDHLFVAGACPDSLWVAGADLAFTALASFGDSVEVGGSVFRTFVSGCGAVCYFGCAQNGNAGELYEVLKI